MENGKWKKEGSGLVEIKARLPRTEGSARKATLKLCGPIG